MFFALRLILAIFLFAGIGYLFMKLIFRNNFPFLKLESVVLSFGLGVGLVSLEMFVFSIIGIPWKLFYLLLPWGILALFQIRKINLSFILPINLKPKQKISLSESILLGLIVLLVLFSVLNNVILPFTKDDEWSYWGFLSKIFFLEKGIRVDIPIPLRNPLLLPLAEAFFAKFMGGFSEEWVKIFSSLFYLCVITVFYSTLRREYSRLYSLLFTFLLASIPNFFGHSFLNFADIPLAFYYSSAIFYFYFWLKEEDPKFLHLSLLMLTLSLWIKSEAIIYYIIFLSVLVIYLIKHKTVNKRVRAKILLLSLLPSLIVIIWFIFLKSFHISYLPHLVTYISQLKPTILFSRLDNSKLIIKYFLDIFMNTRYWNLVWIVFLVSLALSSKGKDSPILYLVLLTLFQILSVGFVYLITPFDLKWIITNSLARLFVVFLPLAVYIIAVCFHSDFFKGLVDK